MTFADLIRTGNNQSLLQGDWPLWRGFRKGRKRTGHACDAKTVEAVVASDPVFLAEVEHLLDELQMRLT